MTDNKYVDRDISWLSFNERVLQEAENPVVPIYERIKFLAIYASNLDEFYRVRVALNQRLADLNKEKLNAKTDLSSPKERLASIYDITNKQQERFGKIIRKNILPELKKNGVVLYYEKKYAKAHLEAISDYFFTNILSFIKPLIIERDDLSPLFLENREVYVVTDLEKDGNQYVGVVEVPNKHLNRFVALPDVKGVHYYTFIDDIIKHFSSVIFANYNVGKSTCVKLNKDAELYLQEDYSHDVIKKITKSLNNRNIGDPARFLYDPKINPDTLEFLENKLGLKQGDSVSGGTYHNLFDFFGLPNPIGKSLENEKLPPLSHPLISKHASIFDAIDDQDVFLSFPYQKYSYILRFFNEAAIHPDVIHIKATLYRVAKDSHITNALISAVKNGKKVSVLVEAKARFDEKNNLKWATKMKEAGVNVVFSQAALKVHSKVALIERKSNNNTTQKYGFFGTGNFNENTASIYTDFALLSSNPELTSELSDSLDYILGEKKKIDLKQLLVSQVNLPERFLKLINTEIVNARAGKKAAITLKLNNLQDKIMIDRLYDAAEAGVKIELIIRGICCLVPRENIRITRIVDRFLEHARVYIFHNLGDEKIYIGSADWMERNLYRRIEVVFPILDPSIQTSVKKNIELQLQDNVKAVNIDSLNNNIKVEGGKKPIRSQLALYNQLKAQLK